MFEIFLAVVAGFVSFISPCVLPLVPAYIGYMGGRVTHTVSAQVNADGTAQPTAARFSTAIHSMAFVIGFTLIFVTLGIATSALIANTAGVEGIIGRVGGTLVIFFGLHFTGLVPALFAWIRKHPALIETPLTSLALAVVLSFIILWGFIGANGEITLTRYQWGIIISFMAFFGLWQMIKVSWFSALVMAATVFMPLFFWGNVSLSDAELLLYLAFSGFLLVYYVSGVKDSRPVMVAGGIFGIFAGYGAIAWVMNTISRLRTPDFFDSWALALGAILIALLWGWLVASDAFFNPKAFWNNIMDRLDYMFYADTRRQMAADGDKGLASSFILGVVFAAGWTPCLGPILGGMLSMASQGDVINASVQMTAYSLGLGIPFVLTALMMDSAQGMLRKLNRQMAAIKLFSGALLMFIGLIVAGGELQALSARFNAQFGDVSLRVENCTIGLFKDEIALSQAGDCFSGDVDFESLKTEHMGGEQIENEEAGLIDSAPQVASLTDVIPEVGTEIGNLAPDFETTTLTGDTVKLSDYRGKVVILNFWATWCPPCVAELPGFQQVYSEFEDRDVIFLAVNADRENISEIANFMDETLGFNLTFPVLLDNDSTINHLFNIFGLPTTIIIDPSGAIVYSQTSLMTERQLRTLINLQLNS